MYYYYTIYILFYLFRNALNIVKDDLIVKVDELTGEQEILREELLALSNTRVKLRARIQELEDEVRRLKEEQVSSNAFYCIY